MSDPLRNLMDQGEEALRLRRFEEALQRFAEVVTVDPACGEGWWKKAAALGLMGKLPEALQDMTLAVSLQPGTSELHYDKGVLLAKMGQPKAALDALQTALSLQPKDAHALAAAAVLHQELGDDRQSLDAAESALNIAPDHRIALRCRSLALERLGYANEAIPSWTRFIEAQPESPEGYWNRARVRLTRRDTGGAFADLEVALKLDANCWQAYEVRATANRKVGDFAASETDAAAASLLRGGQSHFT